MITSKGIRIVAPSLNNPKELIALNIQNSEIIKVVTHFTKQLHIIFLYTKPSCARYVAHQLQMTQENDKCEKKHRKFAILSLTLPIFPAPFFSPLSRHEPHKKIVFLADAVSDETKSVIKSLYSRQILEDINNRDANEMLVRSTGIPLSNSGVPAPTSSVNNSTAEGV